MVVTEYAVRRVASRRVRGLAQGVQMGLGSVGCRLLREAQLVGQYLPDICNECHSANQAVDGSSL